MHHPLYTRIAGTAGLTLAAMLIAVSLTMGASGRPFEADAQISEVLEWFESSRTVIDVVTTLAPLIWIAMTIYGVGIVTTTRSADGSYSPWAIVGLVGVAMQHAIFSGVVGTDAVLAAGQEDGNLSSLVWQLHHAPFSLNNASIALALGGFALAALGSELVPRWTQWVAIIGVIGLLGNAMQTSILLRGDGLFALGLIGFVCWIGFVAISSLQLLRSPTTARTHDTTTITTERQPAGPTPSQP